MDKTIEKTFTLKESFVLWKQESKDGNPYFRGKTPEGAKVTGFYNTKKKNPKEPDLRLIDEKDNEFASLWCNLAKNETTKYLSGSLKTGEKLIGFFAKEDDEKRPFIRVYFKEDETKQEVKKTTKKKEVAKEVDTSELPF